MRAYARRQGAADEPGWIFASADEATVRALARDLGFDRVRLFCTTYDPATGAYRFDYSLFIGLAISTLILLSTLAFLVRELRRRGAS